jgi:amino acid adenylation domain-containing protein/non-ribosomal peptide synthase protein (TIGR01720 family)
LGQLPPAGGLAIEAFARDSGGQQFDLVLETEETAGGGLAASFGYASDLFHEASIARMAQHFTALLTQLAADPAARLDALELVSPEELASLSAPYPLTLTYTHEPIHRLIAARAAERPDAPAVIWSSPLPGGEGLGEGVRTIYKESAPPHPHPLPFGEGAIPFRAASALPPAFVSFAALDAEANRLAHHLLAQGIAPEARIAVMMERSPRQIVALLAILKAGAAFLPLDAGQPPARLAQILADSGAWAILTETALASRLPAPGGTRMVNLDALDLSREPITPPDIVTHPEQLAYLIYTSGSTGTPKAVAVVHGTLSRHCQATGELYEMGPDSRELHFISLAFDGAHERWMTPLIFGGAIVMRGAELWSAEETLAAMRRHKVTNAGFPTAYLQQMASWAASDAAPPPRVRLYSFGGEAMPRGGFEAVKRALRPELLINGYGPTEAVISPLAWKVPADASFEGAYAPIGRAVGERRAYVLDASLNPVPQGVAGELYIGGDIARGYHARPGLTAERFLPDPFAASGARMYRTGDRVRLLTDGTVDYLGRLDTQMKLRGFRIEPGEIEARLIDHETVSAAAIALHETPAGPRLTGYVVPAPGASPDPAALRASLARQLPAYMVPTRIIAIGAIPLTPTGKIDRAALPIPTADDAETLTPPETELETRLAQIWQDTLKIPQIGTNQNFFELGGDSILSLQIVARARRAGLIIAPRDLFEHQTIAELAAVARRDERDRPEPARATGPAPLTPIQSWFFAKPIPNRAHWNQRALLKPNALLDVERLQEALQHLVVHHEALRLRFWQEDAQWRQMPAALSDAEAILWRREAASEADIERLFAEADRSLDPLSGRLVRAVVASLPDGSQRLLLVIHHLAVDGVSWRILLEDLETGYRQLEAGQPIQLHARTASYAQWARHLAELAGGPGAANDIDHWQRITTSVGPLPRDNPNGANSRKYGRSFVARLGGAASESLLSTASGAYRTRPDELMLTALARVVSRWSGQPEILVDLERHGRDSGEDRLDVSRTVGWFTTVFPVRLAAHGDLPRAIKNVKETVRRTPGNGAGHGLLRYLAAPELRARMTALPEAQIAFNYLGRFVPRRDGLFATDIASMDLSTDETAPLSRLITIDAFATADGLELRWTYSEDIYRPETIERLAGAMLDELQIIVDHCRDPHSAGSVCRGGRSKMFIR